MDPMGCKWCKKWGYNPLIRTITCHPFMDWFEYTRPVPWIHHDKMCKGSSDII